MNLANKKHHHHNRRATTRNHQRNEDSDFLDSSFEPSNSQRSGVLPVNCFFTSADGLASDMEVRSQIYERSVVGAIEPCGKNLDCGSILSSASTTKTTTRTTHTFAPTKILIIKIKALMTYPSGLFFSLILVYYFYLRLDLH